MFISLSITLLREQDCFCPISNLCVSTIRSAKSNFCNRV